VRGCRPIGSRSCHIRWKAANVGVDADASAGKSVDADASAGKSVDAGASAGWSN